MNRVNLNLYPRDGYFFRERDGSVIRSTKGWNDLIARVADHRRINGKPAGDPESEVHAQGCANNPHLCHDGNPPTPVPPPQSSLKGMVLRWLAIIRGRTDLQLVSQDTAGQRTHVCVDCPHNVMLSEGCSPCKNFVIEVRRAVLKGREVDGRLNACEKLQADTGTLVHIDDPAIDKPDLPDHCWRKRR